MNKRLPFQLHPFCNQILYFHTKARDQRRDRRHILDFSESLSVGSYSFNKGHGVRIDPFGLFGDVAYCVRDLEVEPNKVADLFEQGDNLPVEVYLQLKRS